MIPASRRFLDVLRQARWLDRPRVQAYVIILGSVIWAGFLVYLAMSRDGIDRSGRPVGTDFASFWTASQLALGGDPAAVWSPAVHEAAQARVFGPKAGYAAFFYPPPYLLICLPLALLPYLGSLALWLLASGLAWVAMVRAWLRELGMSGFSLLPILAFPAVIVNLGHGQNGFLTAALLGTGALTHERRPWFAGLVFGALVIKPHLAILLPVFLLLAGNWRCVLATGLTAVALCLASLSAFGFDAWRAFIDISPLARSALEQDLVGYAKMQSAFAGVRLLGGSNAMAWGVQGLGGLAALWSLWAVRRHGSEVANGAALCCAALVATPFLLDYDLTLLIVPLAWLLSRGLRDGFLPWERLLLAAGFTLPLFSRVVATVVQLPLAPFVLLGLLFLIVRREAQAEPGLQGEASPLRVSL